jgi:hypothetical protein
MANQTKPSNKKNSAPVSVPVVAVVEETVSVSVPPVKKATKKSKKDTVIQEVPLTVVNETVVETATAEEISAIEPVVVPPVVSIDRVIVGLLQELFVLEQQEAVIQQQRKVKRRQLEKAIVKVLKANNKASAKKQKRSGNRQPSGFVRPTLISDELASFLGKEAGTEMSRTSVTNEINTYIKQHNLKDVANGRQINADENLSKLLKLAKEDVLTYFNLQKFMNHHYVKKTPVVVVAPLSA